MDAQNPLYQSLNSSLTDVISEKLGVTKDKINLASLLVDDLGADSLDQVEVIMAIEEKYGIEVPDIDAEKIKSYKDVLHYIINKSDEYKLLRS
jgi:acyl carrier protein